MIVLFGLLGLGLIIVVHEAGHFFAARAVGVEVEVFSIGWGKKLIGFKRGKTEYRISLIPFGGFAKLKGEMAYRQALSDGSSEIQPEPNSFFAATPLQRIFVAIAGPGMNFLFALFFLSLINLIGYSYSSFSNRVVLADDFPQYYSLPDLADSSPVSPAAQAGLQTGDQIIAVNGVEVQNFSTLQREVATSALEKVILSVNRDETLLTLEADILLDKETGSGILGVFPYIDPVIAGPVNDTVSGLQRGDRIVEVNGREVGNSYEVQAIFDEMPVLPEQTFAELRIERGGDIVTIRQPLIHDADRQIFSLGYAYAQGVYSNNSGGVFRAVADGWNEVLSVFGMTVKGLGLLFRGLKPNAALAGPIRITVLVGEATVQGLSLGLAEGIRSFLYLLSLLSVALCFGNLLPIPVLDGGQILIAFVEMIKRSPVSPRAFFRYQTVGVIVVFSLIIFILFSDVLFLIGNI